MMKTSWAIIIIDHMALGAALSALQSSPVASTSLMKILVAGISVSTHHRISRGFGQRFVFFSGKNIMPHGVIIANVLFFFYPPEVAAGQIFGWRVFVFAFYVFVIDNRNCNCSCVMTRTRHIQVICCGRGGGRMASNTTFRALVI